ncbi:MAG TPA: hypothetical protein V6C64_01820 [Microcoleaceae cyanobacterium]|jgi:hypothetical protein
MNITITPEEIEQFRAEFTAYPEVLKALDEISDCEGDLEDAAIALAIQVGQEPSTNDRWIDGLAKRWRHVICQAELKELLEDGLTADTLTTFATQTSLPLKLATPVAIFVLKTGVDRFCEPLTEKIQ